MIKIFIYLSPANDEVEENEKNTPKKNKAKRN